MRVWAAATRKALLDPDGLQRGQFCFFLSDMFSQFRDPRKYASECRSDAPMKVTYFSWAEPNFAPTSAVTTRASCCASCCFLKQSASDDISSTSKTSGFMHAISYCNTYLCIVSCRSLARAQHDRAPGRFQVQRSGSSLRQGPLQWTEGGHVRGRRPVGLKDGHVISITVSKQYKKRTSRALEFKGVHDILHLGGLRPLFVGF